MDNNSPLFVRRVYYNTPVDVSACAHYALEYKPWLYARMSHADNTCNNNNIINVVAEDILCVDVSDDGVT